MIRKANRFHGYGSLRHVYSHGRTVRGTNLSLRFQLNTRRERYRLAIVVSKKVHKSAVVRNKIRRRLYEIVREKDNSINQPFDLVITVFQNAVAELPTPELQKEVMALMRQGGIIGEHDKIDKTLPKET